MTTGLKRILLAEDNPNDAELALCALEEQHLAQEVMVVRDGAEALDYLFRRGLFSDRPAGLPVVAFLDLKMPRVDGLSLLRQMKADPELRAIPVVMLTSSREESDLVQSYQAGVNAYVVKPVDFQEFVDTVKHLGQFWTRINEPPPARRDLRVQG
ncbi:MAG: response regulator [Verrucomicrobia bacterium]|nr:response regulator [Verrucomicrobiota bacterium]